MLQKQEVSCRILWIAALAYGEIHAIFSSKMNVRKVGLGVKPMDSDQIPCSFDQSIQ